MIRLRSFDHEGRGRMELLKVHRIDAERTVRFTRFRGEGL